jgi:hypothetical protein
LSSTASTTEKIAVFAPMPSASVSSATAAKPGFFRNVRTAYRTSCTKSSSQFALRMSRQSSFHCSTPPNSASAARRASSGIIPAAMFRAISRSR